MQNYTQCNLKKGNIEQTAWIPQEFAVIGRFLELNGEIGWDDGWEVIAIGNVQSSDMIKRHRDDYRMQRKASDI